MSYRLCLVIAMLAIVLMAIGCEPAGSNQGGVIGDNLTVTVSINPQRYFLERIGGDGISVNVMVPPGADPHTYEPKPEQLKALGRSVAYFSVGVEFEKAWLSKIAAANPKMAIVDTTQNIQRIPSVDHTHSGQAFRQSKDENLDPHIWLSPRLVKVQSQTIYEALVRMDAEHEAIYRANLDSFMADIDALDADIRSTLDGATNRKFMVFHPSWGYFAQDYGLEMIAIEVGGQEPSAAELAALISEAKQDGIKVIFAQPELSTRAAEAIAQELGGKVLLISPLEEDWLDNMQHVARAFAETLQ